MRASASEGLLDTSVFIAAESGRPVNTEMLPGQSLICPVTIAELRAGVLIAADADTRARRLATLESISDIDVLPIDEDVAAEWARFRMHLAESGRRINVNDLWIAATATAHDLPMVTQDDDLAPLQGVRGLHVIRV